MDKVDVPELVFRPHGWDDYLYWQAQDRKTLNRINRLIKDILRDPFDGLGKPEALRHEYQGFWSRRIDEEHRLVYAVEVKRIVIIACRFHYE